MTDYTNLNICKGFPIVSVLRNQRFPQISTATYTLKPPLKLYKHIYFNCCQSNIMVEYGRLSLTTIKANMLTVICSRSQAEARLFSQHKLRPDDDRVGNKTLSLLSVMWSSLSFVVNGLNRVKAPMSYFKTALWSL